MSEDQVSRDGNTRAHVPAPSLTGLDILGQQLAHLVFDALRNRSQDQLRVLGVWFVAHDPGTWQPGSGRWLLSGYGREYELILRPRSGPVERKTSDEKVNHRA